MDASTIRNKFFDFFSKKGHEIVPSAPLVPKDDPSLLFTNSGMVQFKDYFLGHSTPKKRRVADTQHCLRVSGKHNDLDDVGFDTYHHTLFEMLGNWSFGDYFKKEAIAWAWELLTVDYSLAKDRLYVTVFGGDKQEHLPVDDEALKYWEPIVGRDRIVFGSKKDNFWEMGETGPCGPCSEIHVDIRPEAAIQKQPGKELVNKDHPQVLEIWNLVFIQFNRLASGHLEDLPDRHVDTGMGFERLCRAIQGKTSNYDTDIFVPLIDFIAKEASAAYGEDEKKDIAMRVLADHVRAVAFTIADGQLPSNIGAGYVVRRILRRALRYGLSYLGFKTPFLYRLVPLLAQQNEDVFPALHRQQKYVADVMLEEERAFLKTLAKGLSRIENIKTELKGNKLDGRMAFELYDTYGFPLDLTSLIARENGFSVDENGFWTEMKKQKERSKSVSTNEKDDWVVVNNGKIQGFVGYDTLQVHTQLLRYRKIKRKNKGLYQLVFGQTPYYAESGGQVGDVGTLEVGGEQIAIIDTKKENELIVHVVERLPTDLKGDFNLTVDANARLCITKNHSATHLLHAALRQVLGKHVVQRGSLVYEKGLRFDFSHFAAMTGDEIHRVERMVNHSIQLNIQLDEQRNVPIAKAKKMGAMALFGEKYGNEVRVITFNPAYSVELCGGTHIPATGQIGLFKIISERAIAAGIRRIEAITAEGAERYINQELKLLNEIGATLKHPSDLLAAVKNILLEKHSLEKKINALHQQQANQLKEVLLQKAKKSNRAYAIIEKVEAPSIDSLKTIAYELRRQFKNLFLVLASELQGKPQVLVMLGEEIVKKGDFHAGDIVKILAQEIGGGGGGQSFFAVAGGKKRNGIEGVIKKAWSILKQAGD